MNADDRPTGRFSYDFRKLFEVSTLDEAAVDFGFDDLRLASPETFSFGHTPEQEQLIRDYVHEFGESVDGLGRILMLAPVQRMYREAEPSSNSQLN